MKVLYKYFIKKLQKFKRRSTLRDVDSNVFTKNLLLVLHENIFNLNVSKLDFYSHNINVYNHNRKITKQHSHTTNIINYTNLFNILKLCKFKQQNKIFTENLILRPNALAAAATKITASFYFCFDAATMACTKTQQKNAAGTAADFSTSSSSRSSILSQMSLESIVIARIIECLLKFYLFIMSENNLKTLAYRILNFSYFQYEKIAATGVAKLIFNFS